MKSGFMMIDAGLPRPGNPAELAGMSSRVLPVANATVGAATLVAGTEIAPGKLLQRTGSTAAYTDTLPTAALLTAALPDIVDGEAFVMRVSNRVAFVQTLAGGTGVTLVAGSNTTLAANTSAELVLTRVSATAWTFELVN